MTAAAATTSDPAAAVFCVTRPRLPRPRRRRGGLRRPLHPRRDDARPRPAARLARRRAARRRGVADRVDEVLLRPRPRARVLDHRRAALPATPGSAGASWIEHVPAGVDTADVAARRVSELDLRLARASATAPGFAGLHPAAERALLAGLERDVAHVRAQPDARPERNHRTLELYALLVAALALPGPLDPRRRAGRVRARRARPQPARGHARPTASTARARRTTTCSCCARSSGRARTRAASASTCPAGYDERLARACEFALHCHRPDGPIPALSDGDSVALRRAARARRAACSAAPTSRGSPAAARAARRPGRRGASFPDGGYFTQRSGWGEGATRLRGRALPDLRLRPARRRRPRPLRPAQRRGRRRRAPAARRPGPLHLLRGGRRTCAAGSRARRRTTRSASTASTRRPTAAASRAAPVAEGRLLGRFASPGLDLLRGEARSPSYDADPHAGDRLRRRRVLADRGPARGHRAATATTCASTSPRRPRARRSSSPAPTATVVRAPGLALVLDPALDVAPRAGLGRAGLRRAARGAGRQRRDRGDRRRGS